MEFEESSGNIKTRDYQWSGSFSSEEWAKIAVERWKKLLSTYRQRLFIRGY